MNKLLLHIPHASTEIPLYDGYAVSKERLQEEMLLLTDWFTDDLFENPVDISIKAPFSRIFCDTERFSDDVHEIMAQFGMGVLYEKTDSGAFLREVTPAIRAHILEHYYWKHHNHFTATVQQELEQFDKAIIVDCHSFPQIPIQRVSIVAEERPDFNIGTDAFHTSKELVAVAAQFFKEKGYSLGIDTPYSGSIVPMTYYQKDKRVHSIMLEINRRLYLKEPSNTKSTDYAATKKVTQEFLDRIRNFNF